MHGLYLYCIRGKSEDVLPFYMKGVDGINEAFIILHRGLQAVVSKVSIEKFTSEEIRRQAVDDVNWIKEKAVAHEAVIEEVTRKSGRRAKVIPMRFGTIFKDEARLKETLERDYSKINTLLNRVRGKQEWGVKVYMTNTDEFVRMVKAESEKIRSKEEQIASMPEGMAYFIEEELKEVIAREATREMDSVLWNLFEKLEKEAAESVKLRVLDREMTGKTEKMVLNAAFLISEDRVEHFKTNLADISNEFRAKGLLLEFSGPWPPFSFASCADREGA